MGRATRWLRNLLGGKKDPNPKLASPKPLPSKPRWSFGKTGREHSQTQPQHSKPWNDRTYYDNTEEEQNKHAIAVAAATAAAADAAVAAAQAAVAVVRLTSHGRVSLYHGERFAAVKIQTAFRAYLAKKALRALKALVKLQALVRGFLVRRQAAATLHSMQALIRAQASVRRSRVKDQTRFHPETRPRRSLERFEETRSDQTGCFHSRRLSASVDLMSFDENPKIVEIDPGRPRSRQSRRMLHPTASDSTTDNDTLSSPLQPPSQLAIPDSSEWAFTGDECRFSTAQSTPRFLSTAQFASTLPVTPSKSICGGDRRRYDCGSPGYMAKTQSFTAKVRSQSAPKQRPEPRKRMALNEIVESRASLSGIRMQKSCSRAQEAVYFKNAIVGRFDRSSHLSSERDYYLQTRW